MLMARDIKDKRIEVAGVAFVAEVHLMDGVVIPAGRHLTLKGAQKELAKYPPDVFGGYDDPTRSPSRVRDLPRMAPLQNLSMQERYYLACSSIPGRRPIRTEEECANWDQPYTRLFDRRC
jgi:hypothetical protein